MYLSQDIVLKSYDSLSGIHSSGGGKAARERTSGLRYLFATLELLKDSSTDSIDLSPNQKENRANFIEAVGRVVKLNKGNFYTNNFRDEFENRTYYGVENNFLTSSLKRPGTYPGRPAPLLIKKDESLSLHEDYLENLNLFGDFSSYRVGLALWLLRNDEFTKGDIHDISIQILEKLENRYGNDLTSELIVDVQEVIDFIADETLLQTDRTDLEILITKNYDQRAEDNSIVDAGDGTEKEQVDDQVMLMEKPFDPTLIKIETKTPSLDTLIKRIERKSIQMNTETYFQRKGDLWDKTKQSRLIESILIRFPLPAFFFDASDDNNWLVVDGLQRLSSIKNFVVDKSQALSNLEFLTHLNGKYWKDLPEDLQRVIEEAQVVIYKIMPGTPTDVKFNIFRRINTGGLILEPQEIRHALFQGRPATFIYELANLKAFKEATSNKIKLDRMLDRDFANRFLAFYILGIENYGTKEFGYDLDSYMSKAMAEIYTKSEEKLKVISNAFKASMKLAKTIFGKEAFRKVRINNKRLPPINKALFDALSTQLALLSEDDATRLKENKAVFKTKLKEELTDNEDFFLSVTSGTGDKSKVALRHNTIKSLINQAIQHD